MKSKVYIFLIILIAVLTACSRRSVPSVTADKAIRNFDKDAFNYYYVEGVKLKLGGNAGEALKFFEECLKLNPQSDGSYYQMAQIVLAGGDVNNAKKFLKQAISIDEKNTWYLLMISGLYYQENKLDSAILYYEKIVKTSTVTDEHRLNLAGLYSEGKRYESAQAVYDEFDRKYGVNSASTVPEINNLIELKRYDDAEVKVRVLLQQEPLNIAYNGMLAEIFKARKDNQKALEVYRTLIENNPENGEVQMALCDFLITEKNYDALFELLPTMLINPNTAKEKKVALVARLLEDDMVLSTHGQKLVLSLMILEAAYKDDDIIPLLRTDYFSKTGQDSEAAGRLEEIVKANRNNYYAWERLLFAYLKLNDFKSLFSRAAECSSLFNRSFVAKLLYAHAAVEMEKFDIALEEVRKAEILAGEDNDMKMQVVTLRADVYYRKKEYANAFAEFDKVLKLNKDDLTVLNNYAYYLAEQNIRLKEAEEMIKRVIDKEGDNTTFLDTYAWVLYKRGKVKEAEKIMSTIVSGGQKPDAEWYEHYGFILKKLKRCDEAVLNWNVALKLDPHKEHLKIEIENCTN